MPRKGPVERREVLPDPVYHSTLVMKFINHIMRKGKKSKAERIFYEALDLIRQRAKEEPLKVFLQAIDNCRPQMEVRSRRIGGATYQIPVEVPEYRSVSLSMRWILEAARQRNEKSMQERLAAELLEAAQGRGAAVRKRDEVHRMAEANRAFAHFRW
ncbi:MAG: 30S ribosomal protein S7 [Acidobacteria bacterium]|nr:30S ribosomal protein S7 [Acidobacteriota bacterium]MDW7983582.1 30S ribosomal protein S7 [Acidobacteriota bacterium]